MNFAGLGFFAGGLSQGFERGVNMGKSLRDIIRENRLQDLREQAMQEANAQRQNAINSAVREAGPSDQPSQPAQPVQAGTSGAAPDAGILKAGMPPWRSSPTASPDAAADNTAAASMPPSATEVSASSPTANPDAAGAATAASSGQPGIAKAAAAGIQTNATGGVTATKPEAIGPGTSGFMVGDKTYKTIDEARAAAEKLVPSTLDYFMKSGVPKIAQEYVTQGDPAKAVAWQQWADNQQNQASMKEWASMYRAAQMGDYEKAADHAFNLYGRYEDGITPVSKEVVKDKDGNVTGFNVRLKNDKTGEVVSQFIDKRNLIEMGLSALSPPQMFEMSFKRQAAADEMKAKAQLQAAHDDAQFRRDIAKEGIKADANSALEDKKNQHRMGQISLEKQLDAANMGEKEKAKIGAQVQALKDAGYSQDFINNALPEIIGVGEFKKRTSPEEARRMAFADRMRNDMAFSRKSPDEQNKIIDSDLRIMGFGAKPAAAPAPAAAPSFSAQPAQPSAPTGSPAVNVPGPGKIALRNKASGQVIYVDPSDPRVPK